MIKGKEITERQHGEARVPTNTETQKRKQNGEEAIHKKRKISSRNRRVVTMQNIGGATQHLIPRTKSISIRILCSTGLSLGAKLSSKRRRKSIKSMLLEMTAISTKEIVALMQGPIYSKQNGPPCFI